MEVGFHLLRVIIKNFGFEMCGKSNPAQPRTIVDMIKRFIHTPIRWGWTCNSDWQGVGKSFSLTIPTQEMVVLQGMTYNPKYKQIEVWGYYGEDKYVSTEYNERHPRPLNGNPDQCRPESKERNG